jgi:isopenicillin N synthase-like dioxygenase
MNNKSNIPSVDLNDFLSEDPIKKADFVEKLGKAYEEIGFAAITNHGVSDQLINRLYSQIKLFFSLSDAIKSKYESANSGQRGFTSFGKEHAKGTNKGDLKEFWHFGQILDKDDPLNAEYPMNIFCEELDEFNKAGVEAYRTFEQTGKVILRALALYLNLDEYYFDGWVDKGNSILRPIYYPPLVGEPKGAVRAGAHEDINLITLLVGASAEGLEVQDRDSTWIKAKPSADQIVVNVGDMLQRLTNNKLRSTTHRVVNPPKKLWGTPRFSVPFFLHPQSAMPLNCLESCIDMNHPKQYDDIFAGDYLIERLKEIGLKN